MSVKKSCFDAQQGSFEDFGGDETGADPVNRLDGFFSGNKERAPIHLFGHGRVSEVCVDGNHAEHGCCHDIGFFI